jgi:hypothetical protein
MRMLLSRRREIDSFSLAMAVEPSLLSSDRVFPAAKGCVSLTHDNGADESSRTKLLLQLRGNYEA